LISTGRRLAAIDPARGGPGGLRFQLELALLDSPPSDSHSEARAGHVAASATVRPEPPAADLGARVGEPVDQLSEQVAEPVSQPSRSSSPAVRSRSKEQSSRWASPKARASSGTLPSGVAPSSKRGSVGSSVIPSPCAASPQTWTWIHSAPTTREPDCSPKPAG